VNHVKAGVKPEKAFWDRNCQQIKIFKRVELLRKIKEGFEGGVFGFRKVVMLVVGFFLCDPFENIG